MAPSVTTSSADVSSYTGSMLAIAFGEKPQITAAITRLDNSMDGALSRAIDQRDFRGARDELFQLSGPREGPRTILLVGMGKVDDRAGSFRRAASIAARQATRLGSENFGWLGDGSDEREVESAVVGILGGAWAYSDLKTPPPVDERRLPLSNVTIFVDTESRLDAAVETGQAIAAGQALARTLAMMPGNLCTPEFLANCASQIAERHGMSLAVLGRKEMETEGMGAFLCVAQGTPQDPKLIAVEYKGGAVGDKPIVLVGKGLCFDSGGISIKPAQSMEDMKFDMCGAAGVLGALETIGRLKLRINVVGLVGATTNMPSGTAVNPGDVVKSHLGKFIEIINTDAEGRLVLADLLSYARRYDPAVVVDAATLTGAVVVALGHTATGVFSRDESLIAEVIAAGKRAGEPGWSLPLWDEYRELIKSDIADIKNSGGRAAGAVSAAMFLKEFTSDYPWIHLDIAGTAYTETDLGTIPKGPTGVPTATFIEFVRGRET